MTESELRNQDDSTWNSDAWTPEDSFQPRDLAESPLGTLTPSNPEPPSRRQIRAPKTWNILAFVSVTLGLTASPLSLLFGLIALRQIRLADQRGETWAWSAITLGWLWLWAWAVGAIVLVLIMQGRGLSLEGFVGIF